MPVISIKKLNFDYFTVACSQNKVMPRFRWLMACVHQSIFGEIQIFILLTGSQSLPFQHFLLIFFFIKIIL